MRSPSKVLNRLSPLSQHFAHGVLDDYVYYSILAGSQIGFALLQFFVAGPVSVVPRTNYMYGVLNIVLAALALMARQ